MQFTLATIAAVAGLASAAPHSHQQFHKKDIVSDATSILSKLNIMAPLNANAPNGQTWLGDAKTGDSQIVHTVMNKGKDAVTVVSWGKDASWVNAHAPLIAKVLQPGENLTMSHAFGSGWTPNTGGLAAIYPDTKMVNGQISNSWLEWSFTNDQYSSSTYDVSREVNMNGHNMTVEGPKCTTSMDKCVFVCKDASQATCGKAGEYEIKNCEAGSQPGASSGIDPWGQPSGGCQGIPNNGVTNLYTTLH